MALVKGDGKGLSIQQIAAMAGAVLVVYYVSANYDSLKKRWGGK